MLRRARLSTYNARYGSDTYQARSVAGAHARCASANSSDVGNSHVRPGCACAQHHFTTHAASAVIHGANRSAKALDSLRAMSARRQLQQLKKAQDKLRGGIFGARPARCQLSAAHPDSVLTARCVRTSLPTRTHFIDTSPNAAHHSATPANLTEIFFLAGARPSPSLCCC
jgi:hypothetical protein